jgi:outer membrane protein assembly factor BamD
VNRNLSIALLLALIAGLSACVSKNQIRPGDSLEVAFEKAMRMYNNKKYVDATRGFETVLSIGRGSSIAQDSQWYLADSYFQSRDFVMAAAEYQRYHGNYPRSDRRSEAEFMEGLCYVKLSPRHNLDQSDTYKAIEIIQLYLARYPNSERSREAVKLIDELREKLARKQHSAGLLYLRLQSYEAAAIYFGLTIDQFPETKWAEISLAKQAESYLLLADKSVDSKKKERYELVLTSVEKYVQLFPNGKNRSLVEAYRDQARVSLTRLPA